MSFCFLLAVVLCPSGRDPNQTLLSSSLDALARDRRDANSDVRNVNTGKPLGI